ncbi:MAG: sigma 54-interacting transcriptional regulator, partial [Myxococcales bacterium]|nr:sigma 54-interacting transcriptional regulator [Myxococcales bacterium]
MTLEMSFVEPWVRSPAREARATRVAPPGIQLVIEGRAVGLEPGRRVIAGSSREADVRLGGPHVAPRHVAIRAEPGAIVVDDLGSDGAIRVGGARIERARVPVGGVVSIGRTPLLVAQGVGRAHGGALAWQGMIGRSARTLATWEELAVAGSTRAPLWLHGESGTGKELAARAVHGTSDRAGGPLVAINCAALPAEIAEAELFGVVRGAFTGAARDRAGAFVTAHGGTLLLDEVGDLPADAQVKLLRALQTGEIDPVGAPSPVRVDFRLISATNRSLP